jgi:hypothetical protein
VGLFGRTEPSGEEGHPAGEAEDAGAGDAEPADAPPAPPAESDGPPSPLSEARRRRRLRFPRR